MKKFVIYCVSLKSSSQPRKHAGATRVWLALLTALGCTAAPAEQEQIVVDPVVRVEMQGPHEILPPPIQWAVRRVATAPQRALTHVGMRLTQAGQLLGAGPRFNERLQTIVHPKRASSGKSLIIRSSEAEPKEQMGIEEDMAVMSRILDKAVEESLGRQDYTRKAMGIEVVFAPLSSPIRSLVLEGYGTVFLLNVGFPLLPPSAAAPEPKAEQATDSAWEDAKRELYGPRSEPKLFSAPAEPYEEEKVRKLQDALLQALKNATHIRSLKPDDSVTLCVFGSAPGPINVKRTHTTLKPDGEPGSEGSVLRIEEDGGTPTRGTIMTIRIKKSDADAFAKGRLNPDEFRKKARITTYAGNVGADSSPFPFGFGGNGGFEGSGFGVR